MSAMHVRAWETFGPKYKALMFALRAHKKERMRMG